MLDLSKCSEEIQAFVRYLEGNEWGWTDESEQSGGTIIRLFNEQDQPDVATLESVQQVQKIAT